MIKTTERKIVDVIFTRRNSPEGIIFGNRHLGNRHLGNRHLKEEKLVKIFDRCVVKFYIKL